MQVRTRSFEIKVSQGIGAGLNGFRYGPAINVFTFAARPGIWWKIGNVLVFQKIAMGADSVGQHQGVFVLSMLEVVINAYLR